MDHEFMQFSISVIYWINESYQTVSQSAGAVEYTDNFFSEG